MVRKNMGRQKIQMKKMEKESNLRVTFSKRKFGLFKKASELCTLCGAKILIVLFSPGGKAFTFGHPNVKDLINRFSNQNNNPLFFEHNNLQIVDPRPNRVIQCLNEEFTEVMTKLEEQKKKKKELEGLRKKREERGINWYENVKELDLNQANLLISTIQDVRDKLASAINQNSHMNVGQNYFGGSSGGRNTEAGLDVNGLNLNNPNMSFLNMNVAQNYFGGSSGGHSTEAGFDVNGLIINNPNMSFPNMNVAQNYFGGSFGGRDTEVGLDVNGLTINNPNMSFPYMNVAQNYFGGSSGGRNYEVGFGVNGLTINNLNMSIPNMNSGPNYFDGSYGGRNTEVGLDVNGLTIDNPNMSFPNYGSSFGYGNGYNFKNQN